MSSQARKKNLLLCFDAFGTLFAPRKPIATQYGEIGHRYGFINAKDDELQTSFKSAFKEQAKQHPNYGRAVGMKAPEWWANIIRSTFAPFATSASNGIPDSMVNELLTRFSTKDGYRFYDDAERIFKLLREAKDQPKPQDSWPWKSTIAGVITNSDNRVPGILQSFGLKLGQRERQLDDDISFVTLSYDVGFEKPDWRMFHAAEESLRTLILESGKLGRPDSKLFRQYFDDLVKVYVGDDMEKDTLAAMDAGWNALFLDRENKYEQLWKLEENQGGILSTTESGREITAIRDLDALQRWCPDLSSKDTHG